VEVRVASSRRAARLAAARAVTAGSEPAVVSAQTPERTSGDQPKKRERTIFEWAGLLGLLRRPLEEIEAEMAEARPQQPVPAARAHLNPPYPAAEAASQPRPHVAEPPVETRAFASEPAVETDRKS